MPFGFGHSKSSAAAESDVEKTSDADILNSGSASDSIIEQKPQAKWYQWFEPGTSKKEKRLIMKLDFFLMTYMIISWFLKYLDQTNISNAYVSGMRHDLHLEGNELSWMNTYYNIGVIIGSIPATILAGYFRPRFFLPAMDTLWSLCVLFIYKAQNPQTVYALRFLIGLFESASNPSNHYLIGCWYKKREILRRGNFFVLAGIVGQACSSYIQSGLITSMNGRNGLAPWRWLFIIDCVIGIPVILFGLIFLPDLPHNTTAFWLNDWEKKRVKERLSEDGRVSHRLKFNWRHIVPILKSWELWAFSIGYSLWSLCAGNYMLQFFELYLSSLHRYPVTYVNNFPTILSAVNFVTMLSTGIICDLTGRRDLVCLTVGMIVMVGFIITYTAPVTAITARKVGYILTGTYGCYTPILSGWLNVVGGKNPILRAVGLPAMIVMGQVVSTPYQQHVFPSSQAPQYRTTHGFIYAIAFTIALFLWTGLVIPFLERRYKDKDSVQFDYGSKKDEQKEKTEEEIAL